jgi:hypothetical protein
MAYLGKTFLSGLTWLTATATLFAGFPHVRCLCASTPGQLPPQDVASCLSGCCSGEDDPAGQTNLPCDQELAISSGNSQARCACCCGSQDMSSGKQPSEQSAIGPSHCIRGFVQSGQHALVSAKTEGKNLVGSVAILLPPPVDGVSAAGPNVRLLPTHSLAPPVDLVCLLLHLLI